MEDLLNETKLKFCSSCGEEIAVTAKFCAYCGANLAEEKKVDPSVVVNNTVVVTNVQETKPVKDKWLALILCLLFGTLGLHKFYEGKVFIGICYMLLLFSFFLAPILGILLVCDFIALLFKPDHYTV